MNDKKEVLYIKFYQAEEQKGDELWQFAEAEQSQKRNRQQQMFTSRPRR